MSEMPKMTESRLKALQHAPRMRLLGQVLAVPATEAEASAMAERMAAAEAQVAELEAQIDALRSENQRLRAPVGDEWAHAAAAEICRTYVVNTPRGYSLANRKEVTIAIIIQQAIIRARAEAPQEKP